MSRSNRTPRSATLRQNSPTAAPPHAVKLPGKGRRSSDTNRSVGFGKSRHSDGHRALVAHPVVATGQLGHGAHGSARCRHAIRCPGLGRSTVDRRPCAYHSGNHRVRPARACEWHVLPERLDVSVELQVQDTRRRLGLYDVPVYIARVHAKGQFDLPHEVARLTHGGTSLHLHFDQARLLLPIQDPRGLRDLTSATRELQSFEPSSGNPIPVLAAPLNVAADSSAGSHSFDLSFDLAGTQSLQFLPLAHGNGPGPGFTDGFLPTEHRIDSRGFTGRLARFESQSHLRGPLVSGLHDHGDPPRQWLRDRASGTCRYLSTLHACGEIRRSVHRLELPDPVLG